MKTLMIGLSLCFALAALSGCSSNSDSGANDDDSPFAPLSCNNAEQHSCISYAAANKVDDERTTICYRATVAPSCASTDVRATCAFSDPNGNDVEYWYSGSSETDAQIKNDCSALSGTLTMV